jgi:transposase
MKQDPGPPIDATREELWGTIVGLRQEIAELTKRLEELLRDSKRAKAPFSKGERKANPKKPGRKPGEGKFTNRPAPVALPTDNVEHIDLPLDLESRQCPDCNIPLATSNETASILDIPKQPARDIKFFNVEVGACPCCQFKTRGTHPLLKPTQNGANAHQLGPEVITQALALHYQTGLPLRKVPQVMAALTGILMTQSALTQKACTLCDEGGLLTPHYEALREEVAESDVVNTDDTSWRVNAVLSFVMGFFTDTICFFQITARHRSQEVADVIGWDFKGALGTASSILPGRTAER